MKIHVARNNQQLGQFTVEEINAGLATGRFSPADLAWWEGAPGWGRLDTAPGVTASGSAPPPLPPGSPGFSPVSPQAAKKGMSTAAVVWLVLGIILLVILIPVGLLAAIAIPNFTKARTTAQKHACIANLKQIDGGVQQWALENKKVAADTYSLTDPKLLDYYKGRQLPVCPAGGVYSPGKNVGGEPRCNIAGHTL